MHALDAKSSAPAAAATKATAVAAKHQGNAALASGGMQAEAQADHSDALPSTEPPVTDDLPVGTIVRLHSLASRQELNGQCGHIMFACCEQSKGRVGVFVSGRAQPLALKLENVESIPSGETVVMIGTSSLATEEFVQRACELVNESYGCHRLDCEDVAHRLAMGDDAEQANRVLHLAWRDGVLVGCCSSTLAVGWAPRGCGHWGLLVVDEAHQRTGVASALVAAAEQRCDRGARTHALLHRRARSCVVCIQCMRPVWHCT